MNLYKMDVVGEVLWFGMFFTPLIVMPLVWKYNNGTTKTRRIIMGILASLILSFVFFIISMGILLRDGLGPT